MCRKTGVMVAVGLADGEVRSRTGRCQLERRALGDETCGRRGELDGEVSTGSAPTDLRSNLKRRRRARPGEHPARRSSTGSHGRAGGHANDTMPTGEMFVARAHE
jgi:hypothetical protein